MAQEDVLLRAVIANPDDDQPRLAYARYMDDDQDPRGEFIRVEIELNRLNGNQEEPELLPLAEKSHSMIEQYGKALAGPIGSLVDNYSFERGFVELVELRAQRFLELASQLFSLAPIRHLDLREVRPVTRELLSSPYLSGIRSLSLENNQLTDRDVEDLAQSPHLTQLRWLSLADNLVGIAGAEALADSRNLPNLRYVHFAGNPVNPNQQFGQDQGVIVESWMPDEGRELERRHGRIPWLRAEPHTIYDIPPSRFAL